MIAELKNMEEQLPPPLEDDFKLLEDENKKITKQLLKYEKLCNEAIQIKSKKERDIYEQYYQW